MGISVEKASVFPQKIKPVVIIFFCFFDSLSMHYMDFGVSLEFHYDSRKGLFEDIQYTTTKTQ